MTGPPQTATGGRLRTAVEGHPSTRSKTSHRYNSAMPHEGSEGAGFDAVVGGRDADLEGPLGGIPRDGQHVALARAAGDASAPGRR